MLSPEEELWNILKNRAPFSRPSYRKANLGRFADVIAAPEANINQWYLDLWERTTLALDMDFLRGRQFVNKILVRVKDSDDPEHSASTSVKKLRIEDRTLRAASHNAVAVSVMMLGEDTNRRLVGMFLAGGSEVKRWHGEQNEFLRSCPNSKD